MSEAKPMPIIKLFAFKATTAMLALYPREERNKLINDLGKQEPSFSAYLEQIKQKDAKFEVLEGVTIILSAYLAEIQKHISVIGSMPSQLLEKSEKAHQEGQHFYQHPSKRNNPLKTEQVPKDYPQPHLLEHALGTVRSFVSKKSITAEDGRQIYALSKIYLDAHLVHIKLNSVKTKTPQKKA